MVKRRFSKKTIKNRRRNIRTRSRRGSRLKFRLYKSKKFIKYS